ncbi:hypothetical protein J5N97_028052 [Dioscorea zingiberensis]|uniref:SP-RING-type domain-containing protein n=1 Tax=Dioscorea zingiberensis TaxID=325984 RepID=A0A9D5BYC3_9LILI|nr:hypothetical protein J5N97_028052 [Dioscorea zingiberensis]
MQKSQSIWFLGSQSRGEGLGRCEVPRAMASAIPRPVPPPTTAPAAPSATVAGNPVLAVLAANVLRFQVVTERLEMYFKGEIAYQTTEFANLVFSLAKAIDYSLSINDLPKIAPCLPSVITKVYKQKNDSSLQSAIMVLMISAKNASKAGWFNATDAVEILSMSDELLNGFSMAINNTSAELKAQEFISKIMPRFYPNLKLCRLVISFEAKPGYDILMADFLIPRNIPAEERIRLFVIQTDNLETSACIISPPQVSFLVNGKGVERRTNVSLDNGPQFPTDISKMLKYGTNMIQAVGYFSGSYIIAIAFTRNIRSSAPALEDYVQPVVEAPSSDSELIVGASRISINCPISFRRIKTPVKGYLCKHHQCFDHDNFMEMNSRKPSWRCPCCNQPVSCIDLRIDQNMVKILGEVGDDVNDVIINADGSWKVFDGSDGNTDGLYNGILERDKDIMMESESDKANLAADVMDLTMDEEGDCDRGIGSSQGLVNESNSEPEDRKPVKDTQGNPFSELLTGPGVVNSMSSSTPLTAYPRGDDFWLRMLESTSFMDGFSTPFTVPSVHSVGSLGSLVPDVVMNSVISDAISPVLIRESGTAPEASQPAFSLHLPSQQSSENMQLQQSQSGNLTVGIGTERPAIPRYVSRNPIAVQALPVQTQVPGSSHRMRSNLFNSIHLPNSSCQLMPSTIATSGGCNVEGGGTDIQASRNLDNGPSLVNVHSLTQQHNQYVRNSTTLQQVVAMPAPSLLGPRPSASSQHVRAGAHRGLLQIPVTQIPQHQLPNLSHIPVSPQIPQQQQQNLRAQHTTSQVTTTHPQFSRFASTPVQQTSQTTAALAAASSVRNQRQVLATTQRAPQMARSQAGPTVPQISKTTSTPMTTDILRGSGSEQLRSVAAGLSGARSDGISESPSEPSWRPTGRMRGSLTGSAYAAALSHYLSPATTQPVTTQLPVSGVALSDQPPVLTPKSSTPLNQTQQANTGHTEVGSQSGAI